MKFLIALTFFSLLLIGCAFQQIPDTHTKPGETAAEPCLPESKIEDCKQKADPMKRRNSDWGEGNEAAGIRGLKDETVPKKAE
ncbi:MAG: hypothetical protein AAF518_01795 [Spirochaetota bacterium]